MNLFKVLIKKHMVYGVVNQIANTLGQVVWIRINIFCHLSDSQKVTREKYCQGKEALSREFLSHIWNNCLKPRFCSPFNTTTSNLHLEHTKGQNVYINKNVSMHLCRQILFEAYTNNEKQLANKSLHIVLVSNSIPPRVYKNITFTVTVLLKISLS